MKYGTAAPAEQSGALQVWGGDTQIFLELSWSLDCTLSKSPSHIMNLPFLFVGGPAPELELLTQTLRTPVVCAAIVGLGLNLVTGRAGGGLFHVPCSMFHVESHSRYELKTLLSVLLSQNTPSDDVDGIEAASL